MRNGKGRRGELLILHYKVVGNRMIKSNKKIVSFLLVMLLLSVLLGGCFEKNKAIAKVDQKLELAIKYLSEQKYEEAILTYNEIIKIDSKQIRAYQGLAKSYTLQGKYDEAMKIYGNGIKAVDKQDAVKLSLSLAGLYQDIDDTSAAEKTYQAIIKEHRGCIEAYQGLALLYEHTGNNEQALAILEQAIQASKDSRAYNALAGWYIREANIDKATEAICNSMKIDLNQSEAFELADQIFDNNWSELLKKAENLSDDNTLSFIKFYGLYKGEKYLDAIEVYKGELSQQGNNHKAKVLAAICFFKAGNNEQAIKLIQEISKMPLNEWIMIDLAKYYLLTGEKDKAIEWAEKSFAASEENIEAVKILYETHSDEMLVNIYLTRLMIYSWKGLNVINQVLFSNELEIPLKSSSKEIGKTISLYGVNIGDSYDEVIQKLGNPKNTVSDGVHDSDNRSRKVGDSLDYGSIEVGISKFSRRVIFVSLSSASSHTSEGIKVGDSLSKVVEVYGNSCSDIEHRGKSNYKKALVYLFNNGMLAFDYDTDTVKKIRMYRTPIQKRYIP